MFVPDELFPLVEEAYENVNAMFIKAIPSEAQSVKAAEGDVE